MKSGKVDLHTDGVTLLPYTTISMKMTVNNDNGMISRLKKHVVKSVETV